MKEHFRTLLQGLLTQTTQAGKLDEALAIREKITALTADTKTTTPAETAPVAKPTAPTGNSKLATAKSNGKTDPAAAQQIIAWALANGSTVTTSLGIVGPEEKLKTAPAGKYSATEISMGPTAEGFPWSALAGLGQLTRLGLGTDRALTEAETQHFRHLGGLRVLSIGSVTEAGLQAMPLLPNLVELQVSPTQEDLPTFHLLQERTQSVTKLVISYKRIGKDAEAVFAALSGWLELKEVHSFISIKTALAQHLARLPKLTRLYLFTGSTIEEGCLSLMPQLTTVNFNAKQSPGVLREVASLRNLGWFSFDMEGLTFADFPDFSGCPKLLKIEVENPPGLSSDIIAKCSFPQGLYTLKLVKTEIDEAAVEMLLKFKRLDILQLVNCRFSAAAIEKLQNLKQPKEMDLRGSNLTDTDFKALQKALPKCKINK
ncbi:MAG: hypothetical protein IPK32_04060 [Verrucomicrobiaceae bacterium]|nr:hypothetical protein [Verrucomicrobiaceae bacterium]